MSANIRVAVCGGGVSGASLIHALLQYPHLDAHIFEASPKFREAGIAFGCTRNATAALDLIGPSATQALERAGGVPMLGARFSVARGKGAGELVYEADSKVEGKRITTIVQRANFLHELLAIVPEERMHASKKLQGVQKQINGCLLLQFADGTTHECDILLGTDGIHSTVRKLVLGENDPTASPVNTGWWALMTLQPYEKARSSIGEAVDVNDAREYSWISDNAFLLHNISTHGEVVQFSVATMNQDPKATERWQKSVSAEEIEKIFTHEDHPPHLNKAVVELLCDQPERSVIYLWEHPPARTYVDGPLAIVGDSAHCPTPWQGSGAGMCIEDSLILSTLLGRAQSPDEALVALKVYDKVRRPRTQRLVESSNVTGRILTGQYEESGLDPEKLRKVLAPRWDFILDFDNEKHRDEAIELMDAELQDS